MSKVKRYWHKPGIGFAVLDPQYYEDESGYVAYEDYAALEAELEQAREEIEGMHKSLDKLRGQCAGFSTYAEIDRLTAALAATTGQEVKS